MVTNRPHSAVISYKLEGERVGGVYTPGREVNLTIECRIEPISPLYSAKMGGDNIVYHYKVFCGLFDEEIPDTAVIRFFDEEFKILSLFKYQLHTEILC